jgi:hypothetical protein
MNARSARRFLEVVASGAMRALGLPTLALAALTSGCVPIPFATPPTRVSIGTGGVVSKVPATARSEAGKAVGPGDTGGVPIHVEVGAYPLGFSPDLVNRKFDIGVGYTLDTHGKRRTSGLYVELQKSLGVWQLGENSVARIYAGGQVRIVGDDDLPRYGRGVSATVLAEIVTFANGPVASANRDGVLLAWGYGEAGVGVMGQLSATEVMDRRAYAATIGLSIRAPLLVGVLIVSADKLKKK